MVEEAREAVGGPGSAATRPRGWLKSVRLPLALAAASYLAWPLAALLASGAVATVGFNLTRIGLMVWAGFLVVRVGGSGLLGAAGAGVAIMVVDHILLKGGWFLVQFARGQTFGNHGPSAYLMAFGGVVASFVMFSPLAAVAGLCGGFCGRQPNVQPGRSVTH